MNALAPYVAALVVFFLIPIAVTDAATDAAPASLEIRVEQAARALLTEQADAAGLRNAVVDVKVIARDTPTTCAPDAAIAALDSRYVSRMRFSIDCDPTSHSTIEYVVRAALAADVIVTTTDVKANHSLAAAQLTLARREVASGTQPSSDIDAVVGKSSRRALRAGQLIDQRWLIEPVLVQRGANVSIVARNAGVEVNVVGIATETGRRGEVIAVRNNATGKVIQARVIAEGVVEPAQVSTAAP